MAGTIYEDYIKIRGVSEEKAPLIMKIIVVVIGILCVLMVFVVEKLGNILPVRIIKNIFQLKLIKVYKIFQF